MQAITPNHKRASVDLLDTGVERLLGLAWRIWRFSHITLARAQVARNKLTCRTGGPSRSLCR